MSAQTGFDFAPAVAAHELDAAGAWTRPRLTLAELTQFLDCAGEGLRALPEPLAAVFAKLVMEGVAELAELQTRCALAPDDFAGLPRTSIRPSEAEAQAIRQAVACPPAACEVKQRSGGLCDTWAVFAPGAGTLTLAQWAEDNQACDFVPWRDDTALRTSFRDGAPVYDCPEKLWRVAYAAQKIAEAGDDTASVSPFVYGGRLYVVTGSTMRPGAGASEASAFALVPLAEWPGVRLTYRSMIRAFDEARAERGDERGLVVLVRGEPCVLASFAVFRDAHPTPWTRDDLRRLADASR